MIKYFDEFKQWALQNKNNTITSDFKPILNDTKELYNYTNQELLDFIQCQPSSFYPYKRTLRDYFDYILTEHAEELTPAENSNIKSLQYYLKNLTALDMYKEEDFIFSEEHLLDVLENAKPKSKLADDTGIIVYFILQWYEVSMEEYLSIQLSDVRGRDIHIPLTNRDITVSERAEPYILDYKAKDGVQTPQGFRRYQQASYFRSTGGGKGLKDGLATKISHFCRDTGEKRLSSSNVRTCRKLDTVYHWEIDHDVVLKHVSGVEVKNRPLTVQVFEEVFGKYSANTLNKYRAYRKFREKFFSKNQEQGTIVDNEDICATVNTNIIEHEADVVKTNLCGKEYILCRISGIEIGIYQFSKYQTIQNVVKSIFKDLNDTETSVKITVIGKFYEYEYAVQSLQAFKSTCHLTGNIFNQYYTISAFYITDGNTISVDNCLFAQEEIETVG